MRNIFCFVEDLVKVLDVILDGGFGESFMNIPKAGQRILVYSIVGILLVFDKYSDVEG